MPRNSSSRSRSRSKSNRPKQRKAHKHSDSSDYGAPKGGYGRHERGGDKSHAEKSGLRLVRGGYNESRQESDIKNHILFENIKLNKKDDEVSIIQKIDKQISKSVGPLLHVTKVKGESNSITVALGFKYDIDALNFILGKRGELQYQFGNEERKLKPIPTEVFDKIIPVLTERAEQQKRQRRKDIKIQKRNISSSSDRDKKKKNRQRKDSSSQSSNSTPKKRNRKEDDSRRNYHKDSPQRRETYKSDKREENSRKDRARRSSSSEDDHGKSYQNGRKDQKPRLGNEGTQLNYKDIRKFYVFGMPSHLKGKQIINYFNKTSSNIHVEVWRWKHVTGTNCEYLQLSMTSKNAEKLRTMKDQIQLLDNPLLVVEVPSNKEFQDQSSIKELIRDYQVTLSFKREIHPFYVYKGVSECGKVVQIVSNSRITEVGSQSYQITLSNSKIARQIRRTSNLSSGIRVQDPSGVLVYRPTKQSKLFPDQGR